MKKKNALNSNILQKPHAVITLAFHVTYKTKCEKILCFVIPCSVKFIGGWQTAVYYGAKTAPTGNVPPLPHFIYFIYIYGVFFGEGAC